MIADPLPRAPHGYTYGQPTVALSPVSLDDLALLERTIGITAEDNLALARAGDVLEPRVDAFLDHWYAFQATLPHLGAFSLGEDGRPNVPYRAAARARLAVWILDTCRRPRDQAWLNYQHEIGLRHTRAKKNQTDAATSAPHVSFRYLFAQYYPFNQAIRSFLNGPESSPDDVERMHQAWSKALLLQIILWSHPYVKDGDF